MINVRETRGTYARARGLSALSLLILVALPAAAQVQREDRLPSERIFGEPSIQERILEEQAIEAQAVQEQLDDAAAIDDVPPHAVPGPDTHATREAPAELLALASREPERFIGKILVLDAGVEEITVGPVLGLRKRILDQEPHLIVDATSYFNTPTEYAVAVRDVDRIDGNSIVMPEAPGMHLRGLDYYADDFADIEVSSPEAVLADEVDDGELVEEPGEIRILRF